MDGIDNPPVIASASNFFSFDPSDPFSLDFSIPFDTPHPDTSSYNTGNNDGNPDAQVCLAGKQPTQISNPPAYATGFSTLPVLGTPAMTATSSIFPTSALKPQTNEDRRIAPLPLRLPFSTSVNGFKPQHDQNPGTTPLPLGSMASTSSTVPPSASLPPQRNENMPPPPLPTTKVHGKKRKSIPADETTISSKAKKPRKPRPLSEKGKQKQRQEEPEPSSDNQVPSLTPGHNSEYNMIANGVDPLSSSFPNQMISDQPVSIHPHRALDNTAQPDDPRAILRPPIGVVKDPQHLQHLISTGCLPGVVEVDVTKKYPTRILEMIVAIRDPESQHTIGAYFFPYIWFPEDPQRPYRVHKDDRCFWGRRIYEYHHRVQCGRIGYTIAGSPVLFFRKEEKQMIDSINYHILVNSHRQRAGNAQAQATQSFPGTAVDQGFDATALVTSPRVASSSHVDALPTEEQPPNFQNNDDENTSTDTTAVIAQQYQQSFFPNIFEDSQLNNNDNQADVNTNTSFDPTYNIPSMVYPGPSIDVPQSFPATNDLTSNTFHEFQFNNHNNSVPNIDTNASSGFAFNINDLPNIDLPSTDISQPFFGLNNLAANTFSEYQTNNNVNDHGHGEISNVNTDASSDFTLNINDLPIIEQTPSNEIVQQSFPDSGDLTANPSLYFSQFGNNNNTAFNVNPDALTNFAYDLPTIEQAPSTEISKTFSESDPNVDPTLSAFDVVQQFNNDINSEFDADAFLKSFDFINSVEGTSIGSTVDPGPSTEISQSELEKMYTNLNWFDSQDAGPATSS